MWSIDAITIYPNVIGAISHSVGYMAHYLLRKAKMFLLKRNRGNLTYVSLYRIDVHKAIFVKPVHTKHSHPEEVGAVFWCCRMEVNVSSRTDRRRE